MAWPHFAGHPASAFFVFLLFVASTRAIQVAPNSPCASLCIDDSSLDVSDPNSSSTTNTDITCDDADFASSAAGQKWTRCMGCLQNSTFSQGVESDQAWFFYNLRYNVDYCVFGYPDASDVGSNPCQTSTACGTLQDALYHGIPGSPSSLSSTSSDTEYDYCSANGTTLTSTLFESCVACVAGSGSQNIVANSLKALEAGCLQQLPPSEAVGLSGSVFASATMIDIVAPTENSGSGPDSSSGFGSGSGSNTHRVNTTVIVVIVVVSLLVVAAVSGFAFVCYRKRHGPVRRVIGGPKSGFRKGDGLSSAGSGIGGGFVPSGGITGSILGGIITSSPAAAKNSPAIASVSTGATAWRARSPSTEQITSPLSFQCRASATSFDEMVDLGAVGVASAAGDAAAKHGRSSSASSVSELSTALHDQQLQQQVPAAARKKYQKPQAMSSAAISAQIEAVIAKNSTSGSKSVTGLGISGVGSTSTSTSTSTSHLSAIVESPFPSPAAPVTSVADNIGLRIYSSDFDKTEYVEAAVTLQQQQHQQPSPPQLHQLKTSFSPLLGSPGGSSSTTTPTSSTALLSSQQQQQQQQSAATPVYNPATYSPASYHPGSLYAQSQRGSIGYQAGLGVYHGQSRNSATNSNSPLWEQQQQQQQQQPTSTAPYTATGEREMGSSLAAAHVAAANNNKRGVYQGWSAMVSAAQQYQQQQLQQQGPFLAGSSSLPVSAVGSYRERDPVSAVSVASMASVASSNGLGAATMAVRQGYSSAGAIPLPGDVSATASPSAPGGSAEAVRPTSKKSSHSKSRTSVATRSPHSTRSPQHTQSQLVRTEFLPPPAAATRR